MKLYSNMIPFVAAGFVALAAATPISNMWERMADAERAHNDRILAGSEYLRARFGRRPTTQPVRPAKYLRPVPVNGIMLPLPIIADTLPPWPGATGDGAMALDMCRDSARAGAWPLKVWKITSSDTSNANSWLKIVRDSLSLQPYQDTVYNIVLITIDWLFSMPNESEFQPHCTWIAGQAAQGGGMHVRGGSWAFAGSGNDPVIHDLVVQYVTTEGNNFNTSGDRVYYDHITGRWQGTGGGQGNFSVGPDTSTNGPYAGLNQYTRHFTQAYVLMYEPLKYHPTNWNLGGSPRDVPSTSQGTAWRNMVAGGGYRYPNIQWDTLTYAQNILYNWDHRGTQWGAEAIGNGVGNFHHTGPATSVGGHRHMPYHSGENCGKIADGDFATGSDSVCGRKVYLAHEWYLSEVGNADTLLPGDSRDYWRGADSIIVCRDFTNSQYGWINVRPTYPTDGWCLAHGDTVPLHHKSSTFITHTPDWTYPPDTVGLDSTTVEAIIEQVGNSRRVTCDGTWELRRDGFDSSRVAWFRNNWLDLGGEYGCNGPECEAVANIDATGGKYVPHNPASLGGDSLSIAELTPEIGTPCADLDDDGMPNAFELRYWGDDDSVTVTGDPDADGWFNIEEYLNGTNPTVFDSVGSGAEEPPVSCITYSGNRCVFAFPLEDTDTLIISGTDTYPGVYAELDSAPLPGTYNEQFIVAGRESALVLTCEALSTAQQDSTWVDSVFAAWGMTGLKPWQVTPPGGCP